jgi:hypothetical protein
MGPTDQELSSLISDHGNSYQNTVLSKNSGKVQKNRHKLILA